MIIERKYYRAEFAPVDEAQTWLLEINGKEIIREIGLDNKGNTILTFPNRDFPKGLVANSTLNIETKDLIEITKVEFERKWKLM